MHISDHFDAGNIEVIDASDPAAVRLAIRKDSNADFFQWFHFLYYEALLLKQYRNS